jgi:hypothetical protein
MRIQAVAAFGNAVCFHILAAYTDAALAPFCIGWTASFHDGQPTGQALHDYKVHSCLRFTGKR